ncbi:hypothetical protein THRCLA_23072 [Thraustotheca clavata]|uniref:Uncharacterized protein n=1 Tax=Thraustotheca clavata TaxID=74557 RepID=A0A1V9YG35_9STRA|nr:hypothetical protein THRCLA_23072 [Thraustotheca clavata]
MLISAKLRQAINFRKEIYQRAKTHGIPVDENCRNAKDNLNYMSKRKSEHNAHSKIASSFRKFKTNQIPLKKFNRIFLQIIAPADKSLIVNMRDNSDSIVRSFKLHDHHFSADNLIAFIREHSGADVEIYILPSTLVQLQWYVNPKRSNSERKNFFPYLTKAHYNRDSFQVYAETNTRSGVEASFRVRDLKACA